MSLLKNFIELPIDKLVEADWNYRKDNEALQAKLVANLKRNGQIENIIVRELPTGFYEVVNGNHRLKAMRSLGAPTLVAYNMGSITLAAAQRVAIETNETRFETDNLVLAKRLAEISIEFPVAEIAETMAYSEAEIENYLRLNEFDFSQYDRETSGSSRPGADDGSAGAEDEFESVELRLPAEVATLLRQQISRVKRMLSSNGRDASEVIAVEALAVMISQLTNDELKAEIIGSSAPA